MGAVYQAEHTHMRKRLAVKVLHPEMSRLPEVVARFEREAMAAAHIEHPNVAAATDFGKLDDGSFFLVLEYVEGKSLREAIAEGRLELGRALHITRQIASALGRAHALGIVHRDLKPENVMLVARDGDSDFAKVLDFGIAKVPVGRARRRRAQGAGPGAHAARDGLRHARVHGARAGARAGRRSARRPLRARRHDVRDDHRQPPVRAREQGDAARHARDGAPSRACSSACRTRTSPPEVDAIVTRLLAKEATARFADAKELIEALDDVDAAARGPRAHRRAAAAHVADGRAARAQRRGTRTRRRRGPARRRWRCGRRASRSRDGGLAARARAAVARRRVARAGRQERAGRGCTPRRWPRRGRPGAGAAHARSIVLLAMASHGGPQPAASAVGGRRRHRRRRRRAAGPADDEVVRRGAGQDRQGRLRDGHRRADRRSRRRTRTAPTCTCCSSARTRACATRRARCARRGSGSAADPTAAADLKLQEDVRNAALFRDAQDDAFALLESQMGMRGDRHPLRHRVRRLGHAVPAGRDAREAIAREERRREPREPRARRAARVPRREDVRAEARAARRRARQGRRRA